MKPPIHHDGAFARAGAEKPQTAAASRKAHVNVEWDFTLLKNAAVGVVQNGVVRKVPAS